MSGPLESELESNDPEWNRLMLGVRDGDNAACDQFWKRYGPMIERVAKQNLSPKLQRRVGAESITLSACRTFFRRAQQGEYDLPDADSLWRLLCVITVNKVRSKSRFHSTQKRAVDAEELVDEIPEVVDRANSIDEVIFAEQLESLLSQFSEDESRVLELRLQQMTNDEVAEEMGISERTVRRMVKRIQARLGSHFST